MEGGASRASDGPASPRAPASKVLSRAEAVWRAGPGRSFRLVFTNGCFDLLHRGHVEYLDGARRMGDALLVAVNSDASVRRLEKGPDRPLVGERGRAEVVAALECVDMVTLFDEDTPAELVAALRPDVLVKGGDYARGEIAGADMVEAYGGRVEIVPLVTGCSTSGIVARIRGEDRGAGAASGDVAAPSVATASGDRSPGAGARGGGGRGRRAPGRRGRGRPNPKRPMKLLLATRSKHKVREVRRILGGKRSAISSAALSIVTPDQVGVAWSPVEDDLEPHDTFKANAESKARHFARKTGLPTVADDSGLVVDGLDGLPGVKSRRFAPLDRYPGLDQDEANNRHLLDRMADLSAQGRIARYVCVACFLPDPGAKPQYFRGESEGWILRGPRGTGGFGYDPLFLDIASNQTFAELTADEKNAISHRGKAFRALAAAIAG